MAVKAIRLSPLDEPVVVAKRLHGRSRFLFERVVVPHLRTEHGSLDCSVISIAIPATENLDQSMLHPVDLADGQVFRHLFGERLQQIAVAGH